MLIVFKDQDVHDIVVCPTFSVQASTKSEFLERFFFSESHGFQIRFLFFIGPFASILRMLTRCPADDDLNIKVRGKPLSINSPLYHEATRPYCMALRRGYAWQKEFTSYIFTVILPASVSCEASISPGTSWLSDHISSLCVYHSSFGESWKLFVQILSWKLAKKIHLNMLRCAYWSKPDMFLIMKGFYRPCCSKSLHFRSHQAWATPATRVSKEVIATSS